MCFEHKAQYLLIRAPFTCMVVFWHISNVPPMISSSQICCNTATFCIAAIFMKYFYTMAVSCYNSWANLRCSSCSPLGEKSLWNGTIEDHHHGSRWWLSTVWITVITLTQCWLTHWSRVMHICASKIISIGSDNGLSPGRRQAIIWTNAGILLIGSLWHHIRADSRLAPSQ